MEVINIRDPKIREKNIVVGIDFGTTNSLIGVSFNKNPVIIKNIPSTFDIDKNGNFIIGKEGARVRSIKRLLGKEYKDIKHLNLNYLDNDCNIILDNQKFSAIDITSFILSYLKKEAEEFLTALISERPLNIEEFLGEMKTRSGVYINVHEHRKRVGATKLPIFRGLSEVVLSTPSYFDHKARSELVVAAQKAGLKVLRLISEPTAASYAYGLNKKKQGVFLVYDFGGGTFDISALKISQGIFQVLATSGDTLLGGDDIDLCIASYLKQNKEEAKTLKESIQDNNFDEVILPIIQKTIKLTKHVIDQVEKIDGIILVGGSSRLPLVHKLLSKFNIPILSDIDPDTAIVLGSSLQAENLTNTNKDLLIDVVPLSLGIEVAGGLVEKIIERNTPIPISVTKEFTNQNAAQTAINIHILQGERERVGDCRTLARFDLPIIQRPAFLSKVQITFSMDTDSILSVYAFDKYSESFEAVTINPFAQENYVSKMIKEAIFYDEEDYQFKLLQEEMIKSMVLITKVQEAIADSGFLLDEPTKINIEKHIDNLEKALVKKDKSHISVCFQSLDSVSREFLYKRLDYSLANSIKGIKI